MFILAFKIHVLVFFPFMFNFKQNFGMKDNKIKISISENIVKFVDKTIKL